MFSLIFYSDHWSSDQGSFSHPLRLLLVANFFNGSGSCVLLPWTATNIGVFLLRWSIQFAWFKFIASLSHAHVFSFLLFTFSQSSHRENTQERHMPAMPGACAILGARLMRCAASVPSFSLLASRAWPGLIYEYHSSS